MNIEYFKNGNVLKVLRIAEEEAETEMKKRISGAYKTLGDELLEIAGDAGRALPGLAKLINYLLKGNICSIHKPKEMDQMDFLQHARNLKNSLADIAVVVISSNEGRTYFRMKLIDPED